MFLRYETKEGLLELSKHFQLVLVTTLEESLTNELVSALNGDHKPVAFDAVYCFKKKDKRKLFCYNQIYFDFEVVV